MRHEILFPHFLNGMLCRSSLDIPSTALHWHRHTHKARQALTFTGLRAIRLNISVAPVGTKSAE